MKDQFEAYQDFPVKIQIPIAWGDMDIYNHVNNTNYFKYYETARIKYFEEIGLYKLFEESGIIGVLSYSSCNYLIPLVYPDNITVGIRIVEINKDNFKMEHFISSTKSGLAAVGESEITLYDSLNSKKIAIELDLYTAIEHFENKSFKR